jgi:ribosomal protein L37E
MRAPKECPYCGKLNPEWAIVCARCGRRLVSDVPKNVAYNCVCLPYT